MRRFVWISLIASLMVVFVGSSAAQFIVASDANMRVADLEAEISYRIIGGVPAADNAWPWQVALFMRGADGSFRFHCGGSIIDQNWILTAAHCVGSHNAQDYIAIEGTTRIESSLDKNRSGHRLSVAQVFAHEEYDSKIIRNDIALLRLAIAANSKAIVLDFPEGSSLEEPGTVMTVTGWGLIKAFDQKWEDFETHEKIQAGDSRYFTNRLMEVSVPLVDCQKVPWKEIVDHRQVCAGLDAGGKDSCRGDSGGPLVARDSDGSYEQVGIVSFGAEKCASEGTYGVYSKISAFESWVEARTGLDFKKPDKPVAPPIKPPAKPQPPSNPATDNKAGLSIGLVQGDTLRTGQAVQFTATTRAPGYLVLFDCTPDGRVTQIYPNRRSLWASKGSNSNRLEPGRQLVIPDRNNPYEGFEFKVEPPLGEGVLLAILSSKPLTSVALSDLPKSMDKAESLEYMANIVSELKRDLDLSTVASVQEWSFATKPYRVIQ